MEKQTQSIRNLSEELQNSLKLEDKIRVNVIGAGSAGLAAAHHLKTKFGDNIQLQVFEAQEYHGGRVKKYNDPHKKFSDYPIEMGAEELHYRNSWYGDQIIKLLESIRNGKIKVENLDNFKMFSDDESQNYVQHPDQNKMVEIEELNKKYEFQDHFAKIGEMEIKQDRSIEDYIKENKLLENKDIYHIFNSLYAVEFGTSLDKISLMGLKEDEHAYMDDNEDSSWYVFNKSHIDIYNHLFSNILNSIKYNTPIVKINHEKNTVIITDKQGNTYESDFLICCVPSSQIYKKNIKFEPELPPEYSTAFDKLQMDSVVKIHIKFKKQFWPSDAKDIIIKGKVNFVWSSSNFRSEKDSYILAGLISGDVAREFQDEEKREKIVENIVKNLSDVYDDSENKIYVKELYQEYIYQDWSQQQYIQGGYTYPMLDEGETRDIVQRPLNDKIFFAGEACSKHFFATIHGALQSGIDAVENIIKVLKEKKTKQK